MKTRNDFATRFKQEGDRRCLLSAGHRQVLGHRPKRKPRALRFPAEIEDALLEVDDWKAFIVEAVGEKIESGWNIMEGDISIALEILSQLRLLLSGVEAVHD